MADRVLEKTAEHTTGERSNRGRAFKRNTRKPRRERTRSEYDHRVIDVRRVTRVVAGGRRFTFSVTLVLGDRRGSVGVGIGKAGDTALAIDKATRDAKKNMITLSLTETMSIPYEARAKYGSSVVHMYPSPRKGGVTAGGAVRTVLELAGVKNVGAKIMSRSKNKLNNARAAIDALSMFKVVRTGRSHDVREEKSENADTAEA